MTIIRLVAFAAVEPHPWASSGRSMRPRAGRTPRTWKKLAVTADSRSVSGGSPQRAERDAEIPDECFHAPPYEGWRSQKKQVSRLRAVQRALSDRSEGGMARQKAASRA